LFVEGSGACLDLSVEAEHVCEATAAKETKDGHFIVIKKSNGRKVNSAQVDDCPGATLSGAHGVDAFAGRPGLYTD
jgi:hypothetical protein